VTRPGDYPLDLYRGDSYGWQFICWKDVGKTDPSDLTDATAKAEIRKSPGDAGIISMDCFITDNTVTVSLTPEMWKVWSVKQKTAVWDLQLTYAGGEVVTIVAGKVTITPDVTESDA
jgi:hypothetical protein